MFSSVQIGVEKPPCRRGHASWLYKDTLYIYGGYVCNMDPKAKFPHVLMSDLWALSLVDWTWKQLRVKFAQGNGATDVRLDGATPILMPNEKKVLLIGGCSDTQHHLHHFASTAVYSLDFETLQMETVCNSNKVFTGRIWHSAALHGRTALVFGGRDSNLKYYNDLFSFNLDTQVWAKLDPKGRVPSPRAAHSSCLVGSKWYIFGGRYLDTSKKRKPDTYHWNDLHVLDISTLEWTQVVISSGIPPTVRAGASMTLLEDQSTILLIGGYTAAKSATYFSDTHYLNTKKLSWKKADFYGPDGAIRTLSPRAGHSATLRYDQIVLFGGENNNPKGITEYSDEIHLLPTTPEIRMPFVVQSVFKMYRSSDHSDTTISYNAKHYRVHTGILLARCPLILTRDSGIIREPRISTEVFGSFLDFVYSGYLFNRGSLDFMTCLHLLHFASKFNVPSLDLVCYQVLDTLLDTTSLEGMIRLLQEAYRFQLDYLTDFSLWRLKEMGYFNNRRGSVVVDWIQRVEKIPSNLPSLLQKADQLSAQLRAKAQAARPNDQVTSDLSDVQVDFIRLFIQQNEETKPEEQPAAANAGPSLSDLTLVVQDKPICTSKCLLASRCPFFDAMFTVNMREAAQGPSLHSTSSVLRLPCVADVLELQNDAESITYEALRAIIFYLYSGLLPESISLQHTLHVLASADYFGLVEQPKPPVSASGSAFPSPDPSDLSDDEGGHVLRHVHSQVREELMDQILAAFDRFLAWEQTENCALNAFVEIRKHGLADIDAIMIKVAHYVAANYKHFQIRLQDQSTPLTQRERALIEKEKSEIDLLHGFMLL